MVSADRAALFSRTDAPTSRTGDAAGGGAAPSGFHRGGLRVRSLGVRCLGCSKTRKTPGLVPGLAPGLAPRLASCLAALRGGRPSSGARDRFTQPSAGPAPWTRAAIDRTATRRDPGLDGDQRPSASTTPGDWRARLMSRWPGSILGKAPPTGL